MISPARQFRTKLAALCTLGSLFCGLAVAERFVPRWISPDVSGERVGMVPFQGGFMYIGYATGSYDEGLCYYDTSRRQSLSITGPTDEFDWHDVADITAFEDYVLMLDRVGGVKLLAADASPGSLRTLRSFEDDLVYLDMPFQQGASAGNGNRALFLVAKRDYSAVAVWRTDGTPESTVKVVDIPGASGNPARLIGYMNGRLLWERRQASPLVSELWMSDGTPEGTVLVKSFPDRWLGGETIPLGEQTIFFGGGLGLQGGYYLMRTDGTAAGTDDLLVLQPEGVDRVPYYYHHLRAGDALYVDNICPNEACANEGHYATDGTPEGTRKLSIPGLTDDEWRLVGAMDGVFVLVSVIDPLTGAVSRYLALNTVTGQTNNIFGDRQIPHGPSLGVSEITSNVATDDGRFYFWYTGYVDAVPNDTSPGEYYNMLFSASTGFDSAGPVGCESIAADYGVEELRQVQGGFVRSHNSNMTFDQRRERDECGYWTEGEENEVLTADLDQNFEIELSELLRVIQFYRSPGLHCAETPDDTDDGYALGPGDTTSCAPHDSDYRPQDWDIDLSELLRTIQFYNSFGYSYCPIDEAEDGFCPE